MRRIKRDYPLKASEIKIDGIGFKMNIFDTYGPSFILKNCVLGNLNSISQGNFIDFFDKEGKILGSLKIKENILTVSNCNPEFCLTEISYVKIIMCIKRQNIL